MKLFVKLLCPGIYAFLLFFGCSEQAFAPLWKGPYIGQRPPGVAAELFDPGFFNQGEYLGCSGFLDGGTVFVYGSMKPISDWRLRPYVTPDSRFHFFTSNREESEGIYWVGAKVIDRVRPKEL